MNTMTKPRLADLVGDALTHTTSLFRSEVRLARAEVNEKINQATTGITLAVIGAVLLMPALVILMTAVVAALIEAGLEEPLAALLIGGGALLVGAILLWLGISRLKAENLAPRATFNQLQNDASMAKNQVRT